MKRLTIAVELCANPSILFLDEPTVRRERVKRVFLYELAV
jgi:energy-coupling factor transporter ATP-binding protein EcfA2